MFGIFGGGGIGVSGGDNGNIIGMVADKWAATTPESLSIVKTDNAVLPSSDQKAALAGTSGTPGSGNKYVTDGDTRLPSSDQKAALAGTTGTPSTSNKYATDSDLRLKWAFVQFTDQADIVVDLSGGNNFYGTLAGNRTFDMSNGTPGQSGIIRIAQDSPGGSRTLTFNAHLYFVGGVDPTLTTTAGAVDVLVYTVYTSTVIYCQLLTNMG